MKNKDIEDIIIEYCEGFEHLEFNYSDLPEMAEKIKEELATENNQLERELAELKLKIKDFCIEFDNTIWECNGDYGASRLADSLAETIQDKFGNWTC